jgi:hypothetical protein
MATWKPGDLALCVKGGVVDGLGPHRRPTPRAGAVYTVEWASMMVFATGRKLGLRLVDGPPNADGTPEWAEHRFVKVTPGTDVEGFKEPRRLPVREEA